MDFSIIISVYNEENGILKFADTLFTYLSNLDNAKAEVIFVNDGSTDSTSHILDEIYIKYNESFDIKIITFSKNFGHEAAMLAGLDYATKDYLIFMDSDLQHPVNKITDIIKAFDNQFNIVLMKRNSNTEAGVFKNITSNAFYSLMNKISNTHFIVNVSDFFAFDKKIADLLRNDYREKVRFLRGFLQNIGFDKTVIEYDAGERAGGKSHYNFKHLIDLSITSILSFSNLPLKLGAIAGIISGILGLFVLIYTLCTRKGAPSGYATIVILICFMFTVLFFIVGIIGEYIGILFVESKNRPNYIIKSIKKQGV